MSDEIKTRQIRRQRYPRLGDMDIEHTYFDRPCSLGTWIQNVTIIAEQENMTALDVHTMLFEQLPEIFGGSRAIPQKR